MGIAGPPLPAHPLEVVSVRARDVAGLVPGRAAGAGAGAGACFEAGRALLESLWGATTALPELERRLRTESGCSDRQVSLLIAERRAMDRVAAAGLDPSSVRANVDELLHLYP